MHAALRAFRALERLGGVVLLVLLSPLLALSWLSVRLDSPGPALFRHRISSDHPEWGEDRIVGAQGETALTRESRASRRAAQTQRGHPLHERGDPHQDRGTPGARRPHHPLLTGSGTIPIL